MPVKMNPIEAASGTALLVGDPRRAFALAQKLTEQPRMTHLARGLWGYQGKTPDGMPLTIQSTGVGGPSAVAVIGDLADQGVDRIIRLGTCVAIDDDVPLGSVLTVKRAHALDGASRSLGAGEIALPDPRLTARLRGLGREAEVSSHDLVARLDSSFPSDIHPATSARDLQTAATLTAGDRLGLAAAAILVVSEDSSGSEMDEEALLDLIGEVGEEMVRRLTL